MTYILSQLRQGQIEKAKDSIMSGHDLNLADVDGVTALHYAVDHNLVEVVTMLLAFGADPNVVNLKAGIMDNKITFNLDSKNLSSNLLNEFIEDMQVLSTLTPLHIAIKKNYLELVKILLDYGANSNIQDLGLCTPLHWACVNGNIDGVKLLLTFNADPNMQDLANSTPLHEAVRRDFKDIVSLLLCYNANPNIPDIGGMTAYVLAQEVYGLANTIINYSKVMPNTYVSH